MRSDTTSVRGAPDHQRPYHGGGLKNNEDNHQGRMIMKRNWKLLVPTLAILILSLAAPAWAGGFASGGGDAWGPLYNAVPQLRAWNEIAINASGIDHTPVTPGENRVFGEQLGPGRTSRAMAVVHIAIFDAVNAIAGGYQSYTGLPPAPLGTSKDAAIAQAAHDALVALFPSQTASFDLELAEDLSQIPNGAAKTQGIDLGHRAAAAILALRANDGSQHVEPRVGVDFITSDEVGKWRQDPISQIPLALGAYWGTVKPFVLWSADQFRVPPPPALDSLAYTNAFYEVKLLGGDGVVTPTVRTEDQTITGIYWGYDGTPGLGTPPRLYNQITVHIADQMGSNAVKLARLLALVNVAMADEGIATWKAKSDYQVWRPVTGNRDAGPT